MDTPALLPPPSRDPSPLHIAGDQSSRTITLSVDPAYYGLRPSEKFEMRIDACAALERFLLMLDAH